MNFRGKLAPRHCGALSVVRYWNATKEVRQSTARRQAPIIHLILRAKPAKAGRVSPVAVIGVNEDIGGNQSPVIPCRGAHNVRRCLHKLCAGERANYSRVGRGESQLSDEFVPICDGVLVAEFVTEQGS